MATFKLSTYPIHLGLGASAVVQPEFDGMPWYAGYIERHSGDGTEGRLVTMHSFENPWDMWEVHPNGSEVVLCVAGEITLHQEHLDGSVTQATIGACEYAINEPGVWHTADVSAPATAVFITAGAGTEHRPR